MALQMVMAAIGLLIGAMILDGGGWFIGALVGFLLGNASQMSNTIKEQAKKIQLLESMQEYLHLTLKSLQAGASKPEVSADPLTESPTVETVGATEQAEINQFQIHINQSGQKTEEIFDLPIPADFVLPDEPVVQAAVNKTSDNTITNANIYKDSVTKSPDVMDKLVEGIKDFFLKGNPVVRIGMLVLFFGLSFLVKYAAAQGYFPIELRLICVVAIAIALIVIGWRTRERAGGYGLVLQGGGLAALYLTCFAAAKMYDLIPSSVALFFLLVFVIFGVILAVLQNAQVLAIMAIAGGFIAPILTSDGSNNYVGLFSIYLVLNVGVLLVSWFRAWRLLNWIGFVFTFVITTYWGILRYEPQFYSSTQPFLVVFFLMYLVISILFSLKQPPQLKGLVDGSLVFGLPVAAFTLQVALLKHTEYGVAISSLTLAFIYVGLASWLWTRFKQTHQLLAESFLALGVGFATLAIPLALNSDWTSAAWAFEAAGLLWVGLRQQRLLPRAAAIILYFASCVASLLEPLHAGALPVIQGDFIGLIVLAFAAGLMSFHYFVYEKAVNELEKFVGKILFAIAVLWWMVAVILELDAHLTEKTAFAAFYIVVAGSLLIQYQLAKKLNWSLAAYNNYLYFASIVFWTLYGAMDVISYPTVSFFALPFVIYATTHYFILYKMEKSEWKYGLEVLHLLSSLWILGLFLWQTNGLVDKGVFIDAMQPGMAALFVWFIIFAFATRCLIFLNTKSLWPAGNWQTIYRDWIPLPYIAILIIWLIRALGESGVVVGFYAPLLNPSDLAHFAVILLIGYAFKEGLGFTHRLDLKVKQCVLGFMVFVWINLILVRSLHHYLLIPYQWNYLWDSATVHMALSILWTLCALLCMNIARRIHYRSLWVAGAILLGLVLVKLFTKDLSSSGTLARVVSFMAVGGLILVIGYLSPIPPREKTGEKS